MHRRAAAHPSLPLLLLLVLGSTLAPIQRVAAEVADRPALRATVTISGSSGAVPVSLDRPATIPNLGGLLDTFTVTPVDQFAGIVLFSDPPTADGHGAFIVRDGVAENAPPFGLNLGSIEANPDFSITLPAGDYLLYLLTEGDQEVSVTFPLNGAATGATQLTPTRSIRTLTTRPTNDIPAVPAAPYPYAYSAGATHELTSLGTLIEIVTNNFRFVQVDRRNICSYFQQQPDPDALLPYAPPECPSGPLLFGGQKVVQGTAYQTGTTSYKEPLEPGFYGFGFTRADANPLGTPFEHMVIALEF